MPRLRVACTLCGPKLERLDWLEPYARVTQRLGACVARLCAVASIRHVARFFGLDWKTVKELDFAYLERRLGYKFRTQVIRGSSSVHLGCN